MDALKALTSKLKKEAQDVAGPSKYVKRSQLEEARLQKIREEEAREREEKERKRKLQLTEDSLQSAKAPRNDDAPPESPTVLTREEVIRRLRALGEPATLFAESDFDRLKRLRKAESELAVNMEDDMAGVAGKGNALIELQRLAQERARLRALTGTKPTEGAGGAKGGGGAANGKGPAAVPDMADGEQADGSSGGGAGLSAEDATLEAFKRAAAELAERRKEEAMAVEDRIAKYLRAWMKEWEDDLERRPDVVKDSSSGIQATFAFKQTARNMEPLYDRLRNRQITDELLTGLWMMVQAMRNRNYLHANDIYLKLAIGNAPWPIGVTSVGIHERSAREKISHVMNTNGQAHIMNDEATRKYFQSIKRLITQLQRLYPTDPSRSVDFDPVPDPGKGVQGEGCPKLALIEAERRGELPLALPAAPHFLDHDGSVRVPEKWSSILNRFRESSPSLAGVGGGDSREGSPAPGGKH
ncbi:hypothetical protein PLESTB_001074400 [Pleodorina starrii]|uniref:Pre-mRNA-splicing factor 18 n=1 Tax=Pleodorina starrii TaxID=330485 RepID=A0A9W6BQ42_9CHLO|nr:hypothetical protein PLESTM_001184600 [Pleodorina starrii]GLC56154.1 hypothetical protein PLESTB_001074400 [Pleodorina starrii]GLC74961.1 hypothetical protein PLESTF_001577400 [Pleodorina starrii]